MAIHYDTNNDTRTAATGATVSADSEVLSDLNSGNVIEVIQYNHAHHGGNNAVKLQGIEPDSLATQTTADLTLGGTLVSVASTSPFINFAGIRTDRGDALIESEIVSYVVGTGQLTLDNRGVGDSVAIAHSTGSSIQPYQINGFPLVGHWFVAVGWLFCWL